MDEWEDFINLDNEKKEVWETEWVCQACEGGPWPEEMKKCDRCGERKDVKYYEDEYDADGYLIETNQEIY